MKKQRVSVSIKKAFSLVEVVVALGIFAIAVIAVIGLLGPINQSIAEVQNGDDASRVAQSVQTELQRASFGTVQGFISANKLLYANRSGSIVALDTDTAKWDTDGDGSVSAEENAAKFFEIRLKLDSTLSPNGDQASYSEGYLAFFISMRWPGYTGDGAPFTNAQQQSIMVIPAALTR